MMGGVNRFYDEYYFRPKVVWRIVKEALWDSHERKRLYHEATSFLKLRSERWKWVREGGDAEKTDGSRSRFRFRQRLITHQDSAARKGAHSFCRAPVLHVEAARCAPSRQGRPVIGLFFQPYNLGSLEPFDLLSSFSTSVLDAPCGESFFSSPRSAP